MRSIEIVPALLRKSFEDIESDWGKVVDFAPHIQIDVTDGIFAGDGTYRELRRFKQLPQSEKIELHMMVHTPGNFVDDVIDLRPARVIFHLESFEGTGDIEFVYKKLRQDTQAELALALNPESPNERLDEYVDLLDYVLFMGYNPGWANQPINELVFNKIRHFTEKYSNVPVAVDGHVSKETIVDYVQAGATILCANTAIFGSGNIQENYTQLKLLERYSIA